MTLLNIPLEFILFGLTLLGVAVFHRHSFEVAAGGLAAIILYKVLAHGLDLPSHLAHEWRLLLNLFGLLIGFAILAKHF